MKERLRVGVNPTAERAAMFDSAWRLQRDLFYDKDMHGIDWVAAKAKYHALLPRVGDRWELNDVLAQVGAPERGSPSVYAALRAAVWVGVVCVPN